MFYRKEILLKINLYDLETYEVNYMKINHIREQNNEVSYPCPEVNEIYVDCNQLKQNLNIIRGLISESTRFMAVIKGDAYGHGLVPIAKELEKNNCDAFGVARLNEAYALREAGISLPILIMAPILPEHVDWAVSHNISLMVDNEDMLKVIEVSSVSNKERASIHVKVNTGLNRYGINPEETVSFLSRIRDNYKNISVEGIYTHFQNPDYNPSFTREQISIFDRVIENITKENLRPKLVHAASSSAILKFPRAHYDMVRCGTLLFGLEHNVGDRIFPTGVGPILRYKAKVIKIRDLKPYEYGGYGVDFIAQKDVKVAVVSVGYGDGVSRGWKEVIIAGKRAPIINYFMDGVLVDITSITDEVRLFDEVIIIGEQGAEKITWGEACKYMNTYQDEQVHRVTDRVRKTYVIN